MKRRKNEKDLLERLEEYCGADYVPLHMPGAKRNTQEFVMPNPYAIDITEIDGFDNMHHAEDILKEAFERTAKLFGAEESLWLINGSSAGLLAAICGATKKMIRCWSQETVTVPCIMPFT